MLFRQDIPTYNFSAELLERLAFDINDVLFHRPYSFHSIRLSQASKKLNISESKILEILKDAGFAFQNQKNVWLYDDHLTVLESYYKSSIKKLYKRFKKNLDLVEKFGVTEAASFFRRFIKDSEYLEDWELFECKLDDELIKSEFYSTLFFELTLSEEGRQSFYLILRELKFRILKIFKDVRTFIFRILILNHYHIFSSEEDNLKPLTLEDGGLFESFFNWIKKATIKINFIRAFNYEKNRNFNLQYKTV